MTELGRMRMFLTALATLVLLAAPVQAQDPPAAETLSRGLVRQLADPPGVVGPAAPSLPLPEGALSFQPEAEVARAVRERIIVSAGRDGGSPEQIRELIEAPGVRTPFDSMLARFGLAPTNLADVMTGYWISSWQVVDGANGEPSASAVAAVATALRAALVRDPVLAQLGDADKQAIAESMTWQAVLAGAAARGVAADGDPARLDAFRGQVNAPFVQLGLDLRQLSLTDRGFVARPPG